MMTSNQPDKTKKGKKSLPPLFREDGTVLPNEDAEKIIEQVAPKRPSIFDYLETPRRYFSPYQRSQNLKRRIHQRQGSILNFFTLPPEGALQIKNEEIVEAARKAGLQHYSKDLVRCFADIIGGGRFVAPSIWIAEAKEKKIDVQKANYHLNGLVKILKSINFNQIPGSTSLEKAVNTLRILGKIDQNAPLDDGSLVQPDEKFYANETRCTNAITQFNRALNDAQDLDETELLLLGGKAAGKDHNETLGITVEVIEGLLSDSALRLILKTARLLDRVPKLKMEGEQEIKPDKDGIETRMTRMSSMNELPRIAKSNWSMFHDHPELFWSKALNLEFDVREHVSRKTRKQILYLLIDSSGSMEGVREQLALAVLLNRLKGVVDGEALLQFRMFDTQVFTEHKTHTKQDALAAIEALRRNNFSGGGTDISHAVHAAIKSIKTMKARHDGINPHLAVVSDGQDSGFNLSLNDLQGVVLHAFLIDDHNPNLVRLAKQSGGMAIQLSSTGDLKIL